jgi:hypothetical protein
MNINSPLTQYILEPFDSYIESKNNLKYNNFALIQLSFIFLIISFYYYNEKMTDRSSFLYLFAYFMFYKFIKAMKNKDIKTICEIAYFIINGLIMTYIVEDGKYQISTIVILFTILLLTFIAYTIKFDNYNESKDKKLNDWKYIIKSTCDNIYPNDNKTKNHHTQNFWKVFDFSTLSFIIFLLISNQHLI